MTTINGDFNNDYKVNVTDLNILLGSFLLCSHLPDIIDV